MATAVGVLPITARSMENTKGTNCGVQAWDELEVLVQSHKLGARLVEEFE